MTPPLAARPSGAFGSLNRVTRRLFEPSAFIIHTSVLGGLRVIPSND